MTRHLIIAAIATAILAGCKTAPRENTFPRQETVNTEVERQTFYRGQQVPPPPTSAPVTEPPHRSNRPATPESRSTLRPTPESTPRVTPTPTPRPTPNPPVSSETPTPNPTSSSGGSEDLPFGKPVPGKPGYVTSPYSPNAGYIDVTGFSPGSKARDPYTNKIFRVP